MARLERRRQEEAVAEEAERVAMLEKREQQRRTWSVCEVASRKCFLGGRPAFSGSCTVIQEATLLFHRKEKRVPSPRPIFPTPG